jgi:cytochrome c oxidase accessory protein FixG
VRRFGPWRWVALSAQALAVVGLPFVKVRGESALRFDVASLKLHFFGGAVFIDELFVVLVALLALASLFLLVTLLFGRLWCGWGCPQTALTFFTRFVSPGRNAGAGRRVAGFAGAGLVSAAVAANLLWYLVSPYEFFTRLFEGRLGFQWGAAWTVMGAALFFDLAFLRYRFCAKACPYAMLQGALFDRHTLLVAYDAARADDCIDCKACVRVCPVDLDIRDGASSACVSCTACVDACAGILLKLHKPSLVGYAWGKPGGAPRLARPAVLAMASLTAAAAVGLGAAIAARTGFELSVVAASDFPARRSADGQMVNAYQLSVENRRREPLLLELSARSAAGPVSMRPAQVTLQPGEHRAVRVFVHATLPAGSSAADVEISARSQALPVETVSKHISFKVVPELR